MDKLNMNLPLRANFQRLFVIYLTVSMLYNQAFSSCILKKGKKELRYFTLSVASIALMVFIIIGTDSFHFSST